MGRTLHVINLLCLLQALDALKTLFVTVVSLLNPNGNSSLYEEAAEQLIDFETNLAKVRVLVYMYVHVRNIVPHQCLSTIIIDV